MPSSAEARFGVTLLLIAACGAIGCSTSSPPAFDDDSRAVPASSPATEIIRIASKDGTSIAIECEGRGPTLILVHGGVGDRTRWTPMLPLLSPRFTACAMDRRGHGQSGDGSQYSLTKEAEDVAAIVNSRSGEVFVLGHSYGAVAALEAAFLTPRIARLILYEPPVQDPVDQGLVVADKIERLVRAGQREEAVVLFQTEVGQQSPSEVAAMRSRPSWPGLVATVDSHPRQMRALAAYQFNAERMEGLDLPTLLLIGGDTANPHIKQAISVLQTSLPRPTVTVLEGQQHNAMDSARELLAQIITRFLLDGR